MKNDFNPYSPPSAPVADGTAGDDVPRPLIVNIALLLLLTGATISLFDALEILLGPVPIMFGFLLIAVVWPLIKFGVALWICSQIARGRNWARWVLLAAALLGLFTMWADLRPPPLGVQYEVDLRNLPIYLLPTVLLFVAIGLLFGPGRAWFRRRE